MIFYLFFKSNIEIRKFYFIFKMVFSTHYRVMSENPCQYLNCDDVFLFFLKILLNFIVRLHLTHKNEVGRDHFILRTVKKKKKKKEKIV
jgi:hypothetical protein